MSILFWFKTIIFYSYPLITIIGLITNPLSIFIFTRTKLNKTTFSVYFRFFLLFQCLDLILPIYKMFQYNLNIDFSIWSNFLCKLRFYYSRVNLATPAWFLAIISFEQFMSIVYPTKLLIRKKLKFQLLSSLLIIIMNLLFFTPTLIFCYVKYEKINETNETKECVFDGSWFDIVDLIYAILIPCILMSIFTSITIATVFKSRQTTTRPPGINKLKSKDIRFAITSISNIFLYLIFNIPYFIFIIIRKNTDLFEKLNILDLFLHSLFILLIYLSLISSFFINYIVNSIFRNEIKALKSNLF